MRKTVLVFGIIAGVIVGSMLFITMPMYDSGILNFDNGELVGYTTMVIALSLIFFGVRSYRDNYREGILSFGEAILAGSLITLVASLIYALSWEVCYQTVASDFTEKFSTHYLKQLEEQGKTATEIEAAGRQMEHWLSKLRKD